MESAVLISKAYDTYFELHCQVYIHLPYDRTVCARILINSVGFL